MSQTVLILGAGCSAIAGAPLMNNFLDVAESVHRKSIPDPIEKDQFDLVFKAWDLLQAVHSKSNLDLENIESIFAAFEMAEVLGTLRGLDDKHIPGLVPAIRALIVRTLEESMVYLPASDRPSKAPEPYEGFVDYLWSLSRTLSVSTITFNYDVALDYALVAKKQSIRYSLIDDAPTQDAFDVLKLHGSLNWTFCKQCRKVFVADLRELDSKGTRPEFKEKGIGRYRVSGPSRSHTICPLCRQSPELLIVPPTWNKASVYREHIGRVWRRAAKELSQAENILVFGYSVPPTDHFFHYLYALGTLSAIRPKRFWVFNPDEAVVARYEKLLGPTSRNRLEFVKCPFHEALQHLRTPKYRLD